MGGQSGKKKIFCDDGHDQGAPSCNTFQGQTPGQALGDLRGKNVHVEWKVQYNPPNSNAKVRYICLVSSGGNSTEFYVDDPMGSNGPLIPGQNFGNPQKTSDNTRFRIDGTTGNPEVFLSPS